MGALVQSLFLNDAMIVFFMAVMILLVSLWAFSMKEYAGYILGWLVGIFAVIMLSTLFPRSTVIVNSNEPVTLTFWGLIVPSTLGLFSGLICLNLLRMGGASVSRIRRALTIAILMSLLISSGYILLTTGREARVSLAIFVLTFAIGALLSWILLSRMTFQQSAVVPDVSMPLTDMAQPVNLPPARPAPSPFSPSAQVRAFRQRLRERQNHPS